MLSASSVQAADWNNSAKLQVSETLSNNIALASPGLERHDLVTDLNPSVHLENKGGRLGLNLDASWHGLQYANRTTGDHSDTLLNSRGTLEVIDKWFYVDGLASITEQNVSPFGAQSTDLANINSNRTRVRNSSLTPYFKGMIGPEVSYNLNYQNSQTSTDAVASSHGRVYSGGLRWGNSSRLLNFGTDFSNQFTSYSNQTDTTTRSARATAYLNADAHLNFSAFMGRERNNYSISGQSGSWKGVGMHWTVSERTSLDLAREYHVYGPTAQVSFSHRMPRSALQLSYSRVATTSSQQLLTVGPTPEFANQMTLCMAQLNNDSALCSAVVSQLFQLKGQPVFALLPFVSNTVNIQRTLQGSLLLTGVRNTVTLTASRSDNRSDQANTLSNDVLSTPTRIRNVSLNWALKLTPFSSLTASLSRARSTSSSSLGLVANDTMYTTTSLLWSSQLTPKLLGTLNLRHVANTLAAGSTATVTATGTGTGQYSENAAVATLGYTY